MKKTNIYLERYAVPRQYINIPPPHDLEMVVVIPAYKEPDILLTVRSLKQCEKPPCNTEVIVVLNFSERDSQIIKENTRKQYEELKSWSEIHSTEWLKFYIILEENIPHKTAGPGFARKIGMDEAARRFFIIKKEKGIIVSLDADCTVDKNYLVEIHAHWQKNPKTTGISICFEHPLKGTFDELVYNGITSYELHLRYYVGAQRFAGFPMAFQTVGSCFAVTSAAYQKQGGMNRRKAGEDFYFLHKIIALGNYANLNTTTVYPSPRASDRVPFGTGRSISDYVVQKKSVFFTYNIETFKELKVFLDSVGLFFNGDVHQSMELVNRFPAAILRFLIEQNFEQHLANMKENSAREETFKKAFFRWFDAFKLMKFVHFARDQYYPNEPVEQMAKELLKLKGFEFNPEITNEDLLLLFRKLDMHL